MRQACSRLWDRAVGVSALGRLTDPKVSALCPQFQFLQPPVGLTSVVVLILSDSFLSLRFSAFSRPGLLTVLQMGLPVGSDVPTGYESA